MGITLTLPDARVPSACFPTPIGFDDDLWNHSSHEVHRSMVDHGEDGDTTGGIQLRSHGHGEVTAIRLCTVGPLLPAI
jgi:hypothetical protein